MTSRYSGACLCGAVRYRVDGEFERFFLCHCSRCRKGSGSAHAANLFSASARLTWLAGELQVSTYTLPGTRHSRAFCVACGSALPSLHMNGALLVVPAGSLDEAPLPRPDAHLCVASRAGWDAALEHVPKLQGLPRSE